MGSGWKQTILCYLPDPHGAIPVDSRELLRAATRKLPGMENLKAGLESAESKQVL